MVAKGPGVKFIMAQYPDLFIMHFSMHVPNFVLLSQNAQLLLLFMLCRLTNVTGLSVDYQDVWLWLQNWTIGCTAVRNIILTYTI